MNAIYRVKVVDSKCRPDTLYIEAPSSMHLNTIVQRIMVLRGYKVDEWRIISYQPLNIHTYNDWYTEEDAY